MQSDPALYLAGAQTTGAGIYRAVGAVHHCAYALDVGSPGTLGAAHGMTYVVAVHGLFSANLTGICHIKTPPCVVKPSSGFKTLIF